MHSQRPLCDWMCRHERYPGASISTMPCAEQVLEWTQYLRWREYSFLGNPRIPRVLLWSQTSLWHHFPHEAIPDSYATGAHVHVVDEAGLREAVDSLAARIVHVRNMQPGAFRGFTDHAKNADFNDWFGRMMNDLKWCCATQVPEFKRKRYDGLDFPHPPPLGAHVQQPASFEVRMLC